MRGRMKNDARNGSEISFGSYGLQALGRGYLTNRQIESARRVLTRSLKRGGKIWIRVFPDKPITKRPAEVRMGKGKGAVDSWVMPVRPRRVLFEVEGGPDFNQMAQVFCSCFGKPFGTMLAPFWYQNGTRNR